MKQAAPLRLKHAWSAYLPARIVLRSIFNEMLEAGSVAFDSVMQDYGFDIPEGKWSSLCPNPATHRLVYPSTIKHNFVMAALYESIHEAIHQDQLKDILKLMPAMYKQMEGRHTFGPQSLPVLYFTNYNDNAH